VIFSRLLSEKREGRASPGSTSPHAPKKEKKKRKKKGESGGFHRKEKERSLCRRISATEYREEIPGIPLS